jgi:two-component system phosphate regulon sensor histidine kinase PhoR
MAQEAGVVVEIVAATTPVTIVGDRDELVQVFTNLIENAVKYGGGGGRVEVTVARDDDPRHCSVAVRDFGQGIDPVHLPRLTERFYRAHAEKGGAKRGTGLGLAIVKHIVTRHGGRLIIESTPGVGSVFTVRFDAVAADDGAAA